jgi:7-carboxy-7-deazaguanine synthase
VTYSIKEIFYTLQGEGTHAGRPAVFCRFAGCNLWTGRESDRSKAICQFCDTDFVGTDGERGGKYNAQQLADIIDSLWPGQHANAKFVVFTGGEPLLQLDAPLIDAMHAHGFQIAIESNGTIEVPKGIDWVCISPKMGAELKVRKGNELKVVIPQLHQQIAEYESLDFEHFYLQPMDGPEAQRNTALAIELCKTRPQWKLSLQTHKLLQIP